MGDMNTDTLESQAELNHDTRDRILSDPDMILNDPVIMRALVSENERMMGANIVDMRGLAMERLETRLDRLEDTHRSVISAAYENIAGTDQVHRAILRLLDPVDFDTFLTVLRKDVLEILRVDALALILESEQAKSSPDVKALDDALKIVQAGFVHQYVTRSTTKTSRNQPIVLRQLSSGTAQIYGDHAKYIQSEACLRLDLGPNRLPGLLILGSKDGQQFTPQHGTDLLAFFGGVFERIMRRWLA